MLTLALSQDAHLVRVVRDLILGDDALLYIAYNYAAYLGTPHPSY